MSAAAVATTTTAAGCFAHRRRRRRRFDGTKFSAAEPRQSNPILCARPRASASSFGRARSLASNSYIEKHYTLRNGGRAATARLLLLRENCGAPARRTATRPADGLRWRAEKKEGEILGLRGPTKQSEREGDRERERASKKGS